MQVKEQPAPTMQPPMLQRRVEKTYYSECAGLTISPPSLKGEFREINGETRRIGEVLIEFSPFPYHIVSQPDGKGHYMKSVNFGSYSTDDPRIIAYLDERIVRSGDVFDADEFKRRITPPEIQTQQLERDLEESNRLIAKLRRENEALVGAQTVGAKTAGEDQKSAKGSNV